MKQCVWYFGKSRRKKRKIKGCWFLAQKKTRRDVSVVGEQDMTVCAG